MFIAGPRRPVKQINDRPQIGDGLLGFGDLGFGFVGAILEMEAHFPGEAKLDLKRRSSVPLIPWRVIGKGQNRHSVFAASAMPVCVAFAIPVAAAPLATISRACSRIADTA